MAVNKRVDKLERDTAPDDGPPKVIVVWSQQEADEVRKLAAERGEEIIEVSWDEDENPSYDLSLRYPPSKTNGGTRHGR